MNTDSRDIENETIRIDMCRKRTVYGKSKRKQPTRTILNDPTNPTLVYENNRQMIITQVIVNHGNNSQPHKQVHSYTYSSALYSRNSQAHTQKI